MTTASDSSGVQGASNQERLKGLTTPGTAVPSTTQETEARATLPWEVPGDAALLSAPQPAYEPSVQQAAEPVVVNPLAEPGVYPGAALGELLYWNGSDWDPRPVAPVWTRVWCWIVDNILASVVFFAVSFALAFLIAVILSVEAGSGAESAAIAIGTLCGIAGFVSYFAVSYRIWGRTPGMMLGRLDVVRIRTGLKPGWGIAYLRAVILFISQVSGILAIIWLVITSSNARRQAPHDSAAGTVVLRRT
jgi:uncharacterized RDD family membrane protein YckC